ncbi:MAG: hypothetical protein H7Z43_06175 [Clostridia bacterium]|nr:hypothetical protein [Deltaproteobacteria bacterium]
MRRVFAVVMLMTFATTIDAQVRRRVPQVREPAAWLSAGIGLFNGNDVSDGNTESTWDFGRASNPQYRASLEKAVSRTASFGATASYVRLPFTYIGSGPTASCSRCAAHMDVMAAAGSFHVGGGTGLHQVIEASAGALQYRNLRRDSDKSSLAPTSNIDPYFTFGYGFGYAFDPITQISVVQDFGLALHERNGLTSEQSNTLTQRTIRLNFRYGFGRRTCRNCR